MSYATPEDLIARKDVRTLGDLASDDGVRVDPDSLLNNTNVLAALDDASGELEAALLQGKRYSVEDLTSLAGNSAAYLVRLTCDIAFGLLWERRHWLGTEEESRSAAIERRDKALERLRTGQHIFNVQKAQEAGLPKITGPTRVERESLNLIAGRARGHFYPRETLPNNR